MRRFMLLLVAMALFGVPVNGQSVRLESTFYKTVILSAYASEVITVNTEARGFTLSKIIPADAATKGVAIEALVSVEDNSIRACFDGTTADATKCHAVGKDRDFTITGVRDRRRERVDETGAGMVRVRPLSALASPAAVCRPGGASASAADEYFHVVTRGRPHDLWAPFSGGVRRRCPLAGV